MNTQVAHSSVMTEAETCRELVTPKLVESGWSAAPHAIAPWPDYFWGALPNAYKEFGERVGTIERGRGAKRNRVRAEILKRSLPFSISEIEEACPSVSRDMVPLVLRAMKAEGLIAPTGKGRGAKLVSVNQTKDLGNRSIS